MCKPHYKRKRRVMFPLWDAVTFKTGKLHMQNRSDILSVISVFNQYQVVVFSVIKTTRAARWSIPLDSDTSLII
jgi:hypothetical protein